MNHFIDGGSNIGQTFDDFLTRTNMFDGWRVWCLEPSPRHVPALMERAKLLRDRYHLVICPFGISARSGFFNFFEKDDPRGDSFEAVTWSDHEVRNSPSSLPIVAAAVGIDDFLSFLDEPQQVVLKLDVEGEEYRILDALLRSPRLGMVSEILVEWHGIGSTPPATREQLEAGFAAAGKPLGRWAF